MSDEELLPEEKDEAATQVEGAGDAVAAEPAVAEVEAEAEGQAVVEEAVDEDVEAAEAEMESAEEEAEEELSPEDLEFSADEIITDEDDEWGDDDEDASPIEEFVEPVKEVKATDLEMNWYILKVQVNREKSICEALRRSVRMASMQEYFGEILVPTEDVREFTKAGKPKVTKRKLYPGYIVVNMAITDESWFLVRDTSGIGDFAGAAGRPSPLSQAEIDRIIAAARPPKDPDGEEQIKTTIPFKVGDRVRVKEGYFQNYEGDVSAVDERNGRIEVMINIFGRPNPVDMDHWHVEMVK
jgi:transcriptional antiterminator NusG